MELEAYYIMDCWIRETDYRNFYHANRNKIIRTKCTSRFW